MKQLGKIAAPGALTQALGEDAGAGWRMDWLKAPE